MALTGIHLLCISAILVITALEGQGHSEKVYSDKVFDSVTVNVTAINDFARNTVSYIVTAPKGMPIFGVLNQLQDSKIEFSFTYTIYKSYGIFLESVNGVPGSATNHTYWRILTKKGKCPPVPLSVGIGCYQPDDMDNFIMNYTTWDKKMDFSNHLDRF